MAKPLKRCATIIANDGQTHISIAITLVAAIGADGLMPIEAKTMLRAIIRKISGVLGEIPYSDYGIESITIKEAQS